MLKICLGAVVGSICSGCVIALASYLLSRYGPETGASFISVTEPDKLAAIVGAIFGVVVGIIPGALIAGIELSFPRSIVLGLIAHIAIEVPLLLVGGVFRSSGSFIAFVLVSVIVNGIINGAVISLLNLGRVRIQ